MLKLVRIECVSYMKLCYSETQFLPYTIIVSSSESWLDSDNTWHEYLPLKSIVGRNILSALYCVSGSAVFTAKSIFNLPCSRFEACRDFNSGIHWYIGSGSSFRNHFTTKFRSSIGSIVYRQSNITESSVPFSTNCGTNSDWISTFAMHTMQMKIDCCYNVMFKLNMHNYAQF